MTGERRHLSVVLGPNSHSRQVAIRWMYAYLCTSHMHTTRRMYTRYDLRVRHELTHTHTPSSNKHAMQCEWVCCVLFNGCGHDHSHPKRTYPITISLSLAVEWKSTEKKHNSTAIVRAPCICETQVYILFCATTTIFVLSQLVLRWFSRRLLILCAFCVICVCVRQKHSTSPILIVLGGRREEKKA